MIEAEKGKNDESFVALDGFEFFDQTEVCEFSPSQAFPTEPPTTPAPTEPPGRKFVERSIFQTFWKNDCCANFLFLS